MHTYRSMPQKLIALAAVLTVLLSLVINVSLPAAATSEESQTAEADPAEELTADPAERFDSSYSPVLLTAASSAAQAANGGTEEQEQGAEDPVYPAIKLDVVSYLQGDGRWKSMRLGSSRYTMGSSGCAVTCLAMAKTYRTGKTYTPIYMVENLYFNSDGCLGWPSGYHSYTPTDYLSVIYRQLQRGNPVLVSVRGATTHYVLVTGYTGGDELTADGFLVNDPAGRASTLAGVMERYPTFKKLVYYG